MTMDVQVYLNKLDEIGRERDKLIQKCYAVLEERDNLMDRAHAEYLNSTCDDFDCYLMKIFDCMSKHDSLQELLQIEAAKYDCVRSMLPGGVVVNCEGKHSVRNT